ncbi:EAL domain-containing protein [Aquipuribacter sp. SD81]|uniref:EAL domain-containing protein n=1 Tax=Aquipuribacter sp. SD81 TaxID=3127703 RepID=UPI00301B002E
MARTPWSASRRAASSLALLQATLDASTDAVVVVDGDGVVLAAGRAVAATWGLARASVAGLSAEELLDLTAARTTDPAAFRTRMSLVGADPDGEATEDVELVDGRVLRLHTAPQLVDGAPVGRVWSVRDRTAERRLEQDLRRMAFYDDLTGLANRALFMQRGRAMADRAVATGRPLAVVVLDLDTLKVVNDDLGHQAGDALLRTTAARLTASVRPGDLVARLGGDEFAALLPDTDGGVALALAQRMTDALATSVVVEGRPVHASMSAGTAAAAGEVSLERLLHEADLAMYRAKADGRGRVRAYDSAVSRSDPRQAAAEVARLLDDPRSLTTVLQPICDLATGLLVGHEALTRFPNHPHREVGEWFTLARAAGHGAALEARAVARARRHHDPDEGRYLTVNVSPAVLGAPEVQRSLAGDLRGVVVEVTEDSRLDLPSVALLLDDLRQRGARIAMDDTGAGYDGLRRLVELRPEIVKLDRELVHEVHVRPEKRALVESLVSFCRQTGAALCAEGIETAEELRALAELGVQLGQGWFVGRPAAGAPEVSAQALAACGALPVTLGAGDLGPLRQRLERARTDFDLTQAVRGSATALGADDVLLSVLRLDRLVVVQPPGWTKDEVSYNLADYPATVRCLQDGRPLSVRTDDPDADAGEVRVLRELGFRSVLVLPLLHDGAAIGVLEVYSRAQRSWSDRELRLLAYVADEVAGALDRVERGVGPAGGL